MLFQTVRPSFIFGTQIKIFLPLHRQQLKCSQTQKRSKDIGKTVHVTSVAQLQFCKAMRILFVLKENKCFPQNVLLNISPECKQH